MKKYISVVLVSVSIGIIFMYYFFNAENNYKEAYQFQVGYYSNYETALEEAKKYNSSVIIPDNNGYRVVLAMYEDIDLINTMLMYYGESNIDVTINKVKCDDKFMSELSKYEKIASSIENKSLYDNINQNILDLYMDTL